MKHLHDYNHIVDLIQSGSLLLCRKLLQLGVELEKIKRFHVGFEFIVLNQGLRKMKLFEACGVDMPRFVEKTGIAARCIIII